jgi:hypothetical protein|tara:strand:- start:430 stop:624 length:195 start_codon:yes stop_codon:yes gene_type:complete
MQQVILAALAFLMRRLPLPIDAKNIPCTVIWLRSRKFRSKTEKEKFLCDFSSVESLARASSVFH